MKQAANLKDFRTTNLLPGITINTSPTDFAPIKQVQFRRFKGDRWSCSGPCSATKSEARVGPIVGWRLLLAGRCGAISPHLEGPFGEFCFMADTDAKVENRTMPEKVAKIDTGLSLRLQPSLAPIRRSVVVFV